MDDQWDRAPPLRPDTCKVAAESAFDLNRSNHAGVHRCLDCDRPRDPGTHLGWNVSKFVVEKVANIGGVDLPQLSKFVDRVRLCGLQEESSDFCAAPHQSGGACRDSSIYGHHQLICCEDKRSRSGPRPERSVSGILFPRRIVRYAVANNISTTGWGSLSRRPVLHAASAPRMLSDMHGAEEFSRDAERPATVEACMPAWCGSSQSCSSSARGNGSLAIWTPILQGGCPYDGRMESCSSPRTGVKSLNMAGTHSTTQTSVTRRKAPAATEVQSPLRTVRLKRGFTQEELARLAGMHRNSIRKLEKGTTREVTFDNAKALAEALKTSVTDLGLRVRAAVEARSVRFRRLTPEQRQIVDELLSLPPEDYTLIRDAIERLRVKKRNRPSRGARGDE